MNKIFVTIVSLCLIFLIAIAFAIAFLSPAKQGLNSKQSNSTIPFGNISNATNSYTAGMSDKCSGQFQDFLKAYGQDYSKCLVDFSSNGEYCGGFNPDTQGLSDANVVVILDASGSMAEKIGSDVKIDVAKQAVSDFLNKMPKSVNTGLIVYGQEGSNSLADKESSCKGIEEVVKLGKNNSSNIITAINSFEPKGWTPIAGSLDFAKSIFEKAGPEDKNYLILVSDGIESCDGDPLTSAKNIKSEFPDIKLSVIGFTTDLKTQQFLTQIASIGGGSYLTAENSSGIAKAFNDQLALIKKDCISVSLLELSLKYKTNNLNNLNCWLDAEKKESDTFATYETGKSANSECNIEMSKALVARQTDFWNQKQTLEEKNNTVYIQIQSDLANQLETLSN